MKIVKIPSGADDIPPEISGEWVGVEIEVERGPFLPGWTKNRAWQLVEVSTKKALEALKNAGKDKAFEWFSSNWPQETMLFLARDCEEI
ncbi:MAG: hypothetical protein NTV62_00490 [Candidatus Gribaldobacteria bacterium]|nr:hypothetical protein [Candidatus Gribaldobacteria bacterium]